MGAANPQPKPCFIEYLRSGAVNIPEAVSNTSKSLAPWKKQREAHKMPMAPNERGGIIGTGSWAPDLTPFSIAKY